MGSANRGSDRDARTPRARHMDMATCGVHRSPAAPAQCGWLVRAHEFRAPAMVNPANRLCG
eukprot:1542576-Prymnesium_polylepis.1